MQSYSTNLSPSAHLGSPLDMEEAIRLASQKPDKEMLLLCVIRPDTAKKILESNRPSNRSISPTTVYDYGRLMRDGFWSFNYDTLRFSVLNGIPALIDGQHRLQALVNENITMVFLVAFNVPASVMLTVDSHKKRKEGDVLQIQLGKPIGETLVAAAKLIWYYIHQGWEPCYMMKRFSGLRNPKPSPMEIQEYLQSHMEISLSTSLVIRKARAARLPSPRALLSMLHFYGTHYLGSEELVDTFISEIFSGEDINSKMPTYWARQFLQQEYKYTKLSTHIGAVIVYFFNLHMEKKSINKRILFETFPQIYRKQLNINKALATPLLSIKRGFPKYSIEKERTESFLWPIYQTTTVKNEINFLRRSA